MSGISADYFFNFTDRFKYLVETIEHRAFSPRYYCEDFSFIHPSFSSFKKIYILMKCFCDIPLNCLMEGHIKKYGGYGIGLEKPWGIKNNLTPVHYIPTSDKATWYPNNLSSLYPLVFTEKGDPKIRKLITNYFIYIKPYEKNGYRFYNEREWRYIPSIDNIKKIGNEDLRILHHFVLPNQASGGLSEESDNLNNNEFVSLKFALKNVKYIIVKTPKEIHKIREIIKGANHIKIKTVCEVLKT